MDTTAYLGAASKANLRNQPLTGRISAILHVLPQRTAHAPHLNLTLTLILHRERYEFSLQSCQKFWLCSS